MKAKLLRIVIKKVCLQKRNKEYCVFNKREAVYVGTDIHFCKLIYRSEIIDLAKHIFKPKCKEKIL